MRRGYAADDEVEDVTGSAGWMYTDLLLGLMVIFLATISFIPEGSRFVDPRAVQTYTEIYPTPLANKYLRYDYPAIRANVDAFSAQQSFSGAESVARVQVVVSYDPREESNSQAIVRASQIATRLRADDPLLFKDAVTILRVERATERYFVLEFTFDRFVQVIDTTRNPGNRS
jgi:hypothetical protein